MFVVAWTRKWIILFRLYSCLYTTMWNIRAYLEILLKITTINIMGQFLLRIFYFE